MENDSQWLFPLDALRSTPSVSTSNIPLAKELYDRARGVEFLFRLGTSLGLPSSANFTAATWFHRFYMRYSLEDYHRQDVAASCIFLATKTEECGRKLRDVARVCQSKIKNIEVSHIASDSPEVEQQQTAILLTEEVLLEALCFDFVTSSPHAELVDLFSAHQADTTVQDYAWSIAHDSYRTPLCVLFPTRIIAGACYVLAQRMSDGPHSASLDARISVSSPSDSLPTPPSHKPASPDATRFVIEYFSFSESDIGLSNPSSDALQILLDFYSAQDLESSSGHVGPLAAIPPPSRPHYTTLYQPWPEVGRSALAPQSNGEGERACCSRTSSAQVEPRWPARILAP
ncbi:cyclin-like protein [Coniophora puteana RWD-64-598 SS2]|uniref:Cyclin-like protein n=1 Tax=Coniophora puteana (strain RWD-64-598) TaxID=741705 RepID=A0A5M3N1E4_CONPW|nr:cyclin-like protein [Coniophora puteana RWD-64-598 SS2]EIW85209.1 cyclin-like protein [Coniophora puteana RWD-64-598 SS2]